MEPELARDERRLCNRLTAVTLALQILERKTPLTDRQRGLVHQALEGVDALTGALLGGMATERDRPERWQPLDRTIEARDRRWLARPHGHRDAAAKPREE
jgi:hypothetical protein